FYSAELYYDLLFLPLRKAMRALDRREEDRQSVFCLSVSDDLYVPEFVLQDPTGSVGPSLRTVVDIRRPETFARVFELIRRWRPVWISTKPSLLEMLVELSPGDVSVDLILASGSRLEDELRRSAGECFKARVIGAYGMTEVGLIALEC